MRYGGSHLEARSRSATPHGLSKYGFRGNRPFVKPCAAVTCSQRGGSSSIGSLGHDVLISYGSESPRIMETRKYSTFGYQSLGSMTTN
ncbi:hypothetical protein HZ326_19090 [Fusarium oxysporum f. sp. albedinis]|nr:hypothetical protein HZ326_19090 [Fusarium oxysporum f. sp. albedinis]